MNMQLEDIMKATGLTAKEIGKIKQELDEINSHLIFVYKLLL